MIPVHINSENASSLRFIAEEVSADKYGFFLCEGGEIEVLLANKLHCGNRGTLFIYTPNSPLRVLRCSADIRGILEYGDVETFFPLISSLDVSLRLNIRTAPCVDLDETTAAKLSELTSIVEERINSLHCIAGVSGLCDDIGSKVVMHLKNALVMAVLEAYFRHAQITESPSSRDDTVVNRFLLMLYEHCRSQRSVRFYASAMGLSPYYFSNIVKRESGKSVTQWIEDTTITMIKQYLHTTELSMKEISAKMNFPDQSAFGRYVKQHLGMSPSQYRNRHNPSD